MKYRVNPVKKTAERAEKVESRIALSSVFIAQFFGLLGFVSEWFLIPASVCAIVSLVFILKAIDSFGVNKEHDGWNKGYKDGTGIDLTQTEDVQFIEYD